jgi:hypothetical protein
VGVGAVSGAPPKYRAVGDPCQPADHSSRHLVITRPAAGDPTIDHVIEMIRPRPGHHLARDVMSVLG